VRPIVTITLNPAVDGASEADAIRPTNKIRTSNERYDPGGGGLNVARGIRELGREALAVYLAGGATGSVLDSLLSRFGIPRRPISIENDTRVSQVVYERSTGLEYRFVAEGPVVHEREWQHSLRILDQLDWDVIVASGSLPRGVPDDYYVEVAEMTARRGGRLVLDTSGEALRRSLDAGGIYLAKPSVGEFEKFLGRSLVEPGAVEEAARDLVATGRVSLVAVTLGKEGAVLAHAGGVLRLAAPDIAEKSAVGAGDSFVAGMVVGLAEGREPEDAFALGVATGSAAAMTAGTELFHRRDVEQLYAGITGRPLIV
jgi:6-phosphofructokinase 2